MRFEKVLAAAADLTRGSGARTTALVATGARSSRSSKKDCKAAIGSICRASGRPQRTAATASAVFKTVAEEAPTAAKADAWVAAAAAQAAATTAAKAAAEEVAAAPEAPAETPQDQAAARSTRRSARRPTPARTLRRQRPRPLREGPRQPSSSSLRGGYADRGTRSPLAGTLGRRASGSFAK